MECGSLFYLFLLCTNRCLSLSPVHPISISQAVAVPNVDRVGNGELLKAMVSLFSRREVAKPNQNTIPTGVQAQVSDVQRPDQAASAQRESQVDVQKLMEENNVYVCPIYDDANLLLTTG